MKYIYRASGGFIALSIFLVGMLFFMGAVLILQKNVWYETLIPFALAIAYIYHLVRMRIVIDGETLICRGLFRTFIVPLPSITSASFDIVRSPYAPQGVACFRMQSDTNEEYKLPPKLFHIDASARLFAILNKNGVNVEVPDHWHAEYLFGKIKQRQNVLNVE